MTLVPAGKIRVMVAQNISNPSSEGYTGGVPAETPVRPEEEMNAASPADPSLEMEEPMGDPMGEQIEEPMEGQVEEPISKKGKATLTDYIFNKLQEFGYPGRRLEEFKKKFVDQSISPDGTETIQIEIPDKRYPDPNTGQADTIETEDLGQLVRDVNSKFGLNFNGAHRSEGRWSIDFTTSEVTSENGEEDMVRDNLDDVYGTPAGGKKDDSRFNKDAVMETSIKEAKDKIINQLKTIIGDKDAT